MIDYTTELERVSRLIDIPLNRTIQACRTGRYREPQLLGYVWTALDVWVSQHRPHVRPPVKRDHSAWSNLIRAIAAYEILLTFLEAMDTPAEKTPATGESEK